MGAKFNQWETVVIPDTLEQMLRNKERMNVTTDVMDNLGKPAIITEVVAHNRGGGYSYLLNVTGKYPWPEEVLIPVKEEIRVYPRGAQVMAIHTRDGKTVRSGVARVSPSDTYEFGRGAEVALERLLGHRAPIDTVAKEAKEMDWEAYLEEQSASLRIDSDGEQFDSVYACGVRAAQLLSEGEFVRVREPDHLQVIINIMKNRLPSSIRLILQDSNLSTKARTHYIQMNYESFGSHDTNAAVIRTVPKAELYANGKHIAYEMKGNCMGYLSIERGTNKTNDRMDPLLCGYVEL